MNKSEQLKNKLTSIDEAAAFSIVVDIEDGKLKLDFSKHLDVGGLSTNLVFDRLVRMMDPSKIVVNRSEKYIREV